MTHVNKWQRLSLQDIQTLLGAAKNSWWIAGGVAIDLFLEKETRSHEDLDIIIDRKDQIYFQQHLNNWDLQATDPPGSLRPINENEILPENVNAIWCREFGSEVWRFEFLLATFTDNEWVYRRNPKIRGPLNSFGWTTHDGIRVISPEIQLLYKSKARRPKDEQDFVNCLSKLNSEKRAWLKNVLSIEHESNHDWIKGL